MLLRTTSCVIVLLLAACAGNPPRDVAGDDAIIMASARGWDIKSGANGETVFISPNNVRQNVGRTQYPDVALAHLYKITKPDSAQECLVLYVPPVASGGATMTVFEISGTSLIRLYDIHHRYEFVTIPNQSENPHVGLVDTPGGIGLGRLIFAEPGDEQVARLREIYEQPFSRPKSAR